MDPEADALLQAYYRDVVGTSVVYATHAGRSRVHTSDMKLANNQCRVTWSDRMAAPEVGIEAMTRSAGPPPAMAFVASDAEFTASVCECATCVGCNTAAPPPHIDAFDQLDRVLWHAVSAEVAGLADHEPVGSQPLVL